MERKSLSRRNFVKGSAVVLAGAAAAALAGCAGGGSQTAVSQAPAASSAAAAGQSSSAAAAQVSQGSSHAAAGAGPKVYFTSGVSADALQAAYDALGFEPAGKVAVKISTGEPGSNYLHPELIGGLVGTLGASIVECNTAYGGDRSNTESHLQVAADHGFTDIAEVDIMDAEGEESLPVTGGAHLTEDIVGSHLANYGSMVSLAHFKGHTMGGFGGALKNISIGVASSAGKLLIHSAGETSEHWSSAAQDDFLESMAEAASAVCDRFGGEICFVNVMNRLSVDCDCDTSPAEPQMADIGILASMDPVALDQACVDLVYAASDGQALVERIESRNGIHTLEHAEELGVGSRTYDLVRI